METQPEFNPEKNHDAICIIKMPDGNYKGYAWRSGKLVIERQGDPQTVLTLLLTHP